MTENCDTEISFFRCKRMDALMLLIVWGLLSGIVDILWYFSQWSLFLSFVVQLGATFSWCKYDAQMRRFVMPSGMMGCIITMALIGASSAYNQRFNNIRSILPIGLSSSFLIDSLTLRAACGCLSPLRSGSKTLRVSVGAAFPRAS